MTPTLTEITAEDVNTLHRVSRKIRAHLANAVAIADPDDLDASALLAVAGTVDALLAVEQLACAIARIIANAPSSERAS